ncbi:hypothetical protein FQA47_017980 [Oryzias melastigma]|uniref:Uncharacterized protein n=1 Tax=Oryzias melastigma TaxID=30732 RepID=A0A834FEU8_ORYME|nr:hypothetical protein FQA47_017980 [Oryzias melastigma]
MCFNYNTNNSKLKEVVFSSCTFRSLKNKHVQTVELVKCLFILHYSTTSIKQIKTYQNRKELRQLEKKKNILFSFELYEKQSLGLIVRSHPCEEKPFHQMFEAQLNGSASTRMLSHQHKMRT